LKYYSLVKFTKDNGADAKKSDNDKDISGDAGLQPRGSNYLQHGSSVSYTLTIKKEDWVSRSQPMDYRLIHRGLLIALF